MSGDNELVRGMDLDEPNDQPPAQPSNEQNGDDRLNNSVNGGQAGRSGNLSGSRRRRMEDSKDEDEEKIESKWALSDEHKRQLDFLKTVRMPNAKRLKAGATNAEFLQHCLQMKERCLQFARLVST